MTSARDGREASHGSRASDSAKCLLVVGGYVRNVPVLEGVVDEVKDRIELSPSMVDFFEIRFVDMGVRPEPSADVGPGVARLALEFTSRPGDAARNFSALIVVDSRASAIDRVFRACRTNDVMSKLNVRYLGLASSDDRKPPAPPAADGIKIVIAPDGNQPAERIVASIYRQAEFLLHDFGSGEERGVTMTSLNKIGSEAEPDLRRVIATSAKADEEAALRVREARAMAQAELQRKAEAQRRQAEERQRAEVRQRQATEERRLAAIRQEREAEERRLAEARQGREAEERRLAEIQRRQEADRMMDQIQRRQEADRIADEYRKKHEEQRRSEQQPPAARPVEAEDQRAVAVAGPGESPDGPGKPADPRPDDNGQPRAGRADPPQARSEPPASPKPSASPADDSRRRPDGSQPEAEGSAREETQRAGGLQAVLRSVRVLRLALPPAKNISGPETKPEIVDAARMLHDCAATLWKHDHKRAKARISALRDYADGELTVEEQRRCRDVVIRERLLRPELPVGNLGGQFYDLVLRLAFGRPFDYPRYCDVERQMAVFGRTGSLPHRPMLEAIDRSGTTDIRVLALTRCHLGPDRLEKWFHSREVDVRGLIIALAAGEWSTPEHADITFTVLGRYLDGLKREDDRQAAVAALHDSGYLAGALFQRSPKSTTRQVSVLIPILRTAYPRGLNATDIVEVFAVSVPTPALARVALQRLATPDDRSLVIREFTRANGHEEIDVLQESRLLDLFMTDRET